MMFEKLPKLCTEMVTWGAANSDELQSCKNNIYGTSIIQHAWLYRELEPTFEHAFDSVSFLAWAGESCTISDISNQFRRWWSQNEHDP